MTTLEAIALSISVGLALAALGYVVGSWRESRRRDDRHIRDVSLYIKALDDASQNANWTTCVLAETHVELAAKEAELARCRLFIKEAFGGMPEAKESAKWTN